MNPASPRPRLTLPAIGPALIVVELVLFVLLGHAIGLAATLGWTALTALLGVQVWSRLQGFGPASLREALSRGELYAPAQSAELLLRALSGLLLFLPGLLTDVIGLLLLVPAVRRMVSRALRRRAAGGISPDARKEPRYRKSRRTGGATVAVEIIPPTQAPPSPFVKPRRVITVDSEVD